MVVLCHVPQDIPEALQKKAIERVVEVLQRVAVAKDIASDMKKHFDQECGGTWHCVVGRSFGCSVTHETKYLLFFRQAAQMPALAAAHV
ncbi:dynein light chain 2 [Tribonema minus]|uniref:Dynein light chain n=1 Tax=Tribonema minus TaxID=303371 RepID=A0A835YLR1_9STRA|nr:dynein light chain 2 [Tribonema minus]